MDIQINYQICLIWTCSRDVEFALSNVFDEVILLCAMAPGNIMCKIIMIFYIHPYHGCKH